MTERVLFARPDLLLLVAIPPLLLALRLAALAARGRSLRAFAGPGAAFASRSVGRELAKALLVATAVGGLAVALAGPQIGVTERVVSQTGADVVIALDVSQSMAVRDAAPDRLGAARRVVERLGRELEGGRVGLVLFAGQGLVRYPLTSDPAVLGQALAASGHSFRLPGGSSLGAGIETALSLFPRAEKEAAGPGGALPPGRSSADEGRRKRAILVVSDGEDPRGAPDVGNARLREVRVYALGVGTSAGGEVPTYDLEGKQTGVLRTPGGAPVVSRLNEEALRAVAERGDGRYWHYTGDDAVLREVALSLRALDTSELTTELAPADRYQWFLAIALFVLVLESLIGERGRMRLPRPRFVARSSGDLVPGLSASSRRRA